MKCKKILAVVLTVAMILSCFSFGAMAATVTDPMTIDTYFVLENVSITATEGPAITIAEGADVTLEVVGDNYVKGARGFAGIYVPESAKLTIVGSGTLKAVGGDAAEFKSDDYNCYNLRYYYSAGAAIGGNGSFYMRDKHTDTKGKYFDRTHPNYYEEVYSNGMKGNEYIILSNSNFGEIVIDMDETGKIDAKGGSSVDTENQGSGAGIGSGGSDSVTHKIVSNGVVSEEYDIPFNGLITINSGNIAATGGSGYNSSSANSGAGIGAGSCSRAVADNEIDITITGGTIVANGSADSAAIGGGAHVQGGDITITGGNIIATSGTETTESGSGAGIGAGHMAYEGIIRIDGDAVVAATANGNAAGIGAGADTYFNTDGVDTDELHCENVIFAGSAQVEFNGGKTTFFTVEGNDVAFSSSTAVCSIVNDAGVMVGLASSFDEAVSVINEFANVTTLRLIKDTPAAKSVVIEDNITIDGDGYVLYGEAGVTPAKVNGVTVYLNNIIIKGGVAGEPADGASLMAAGDNAGNALEVDNATVYITNSELRGGDSYITSAANYTGSAIVEQNNSVVYVEDSTFGNGKIYGDVISAPIVNLDTTSKIYLTNVILDGAEAKTAGGAPLVSTFTDGAYDADDERTIYVSGELRVPGAELDNVIIEGDDFKLIGNFGGGMVADTLTVVYKPVAIADAVEEEVADLYDIYIKGNAKFINRLNSADLTFLFTSKDAKNAAMSYEILPVAPVTIARDDENDNRFMFYFDGVTQPDETADEIKIAQAKIKGYGEYELVVDPDAENIVNAAKTVDNIVENFYVGGIAAGNGELDIDNSAAGEIKIPRRTLTVNVSFPNEIKANVKEYQQMTINVKGEGVDDTRYLAEGLEGTDVVYYVEEFGDVILNTPYTVTIEGLGYRTVKYTVNMTENKTLNFWNNVRDNEKAVEVSESGVEKYAQKVTFLAGDIVKDNNINVYDLSAVVSYFGEIDLDADNNPQYAKYDLNRDGKIDSKDVAYVLVSWNN